MVEETLEYILAEEPDLLYIGGPPTYLAGRVREESLERARQNPTILAGEVPRVIVDHHLLRDPKWWAFLGPACAAAQAAGHELLCAAEFLGEEVQGFEAHWGELYREEPPPPGWEGILNGMEYRPS